MGAVVDRSHGRGDLQGYEPVGYALHPLRHRPLTNGTRKH